MSSRNNSGLTAAFVRRISKPGKYYDRHGLYLRVSPSGRRYWEQRLTFNRRRRSLGVGSFPQISLKEARAKALKTLVLVADGGDPFLAGQSRSSIPTFAEAARDVLVLRSARWTADTMLPSWQRTFDRDVFPYIGDMRVTDVRPRDILDLARPLLVNVPASAHTLRWRVGAVMRWVVRQGYRTDNPVDALADEFRGGPPTEYHPALHYAHVSSALATVRAAGVWIGLQLFFEFLVLTAVRTNEARGALWSEFDFTQSMWTVPAGRMKARLAHRVPLSSGALAVLAQARPLGDGTGLVFRTIHGRRFYNNALSNLMSDLEISAVPHGFRSSFREWCGDTRVDSDVAEFCLAHRPQSTAKSRYQRGDLYIPRVDIMEAWARYLGFSTASTDE